MADFNVTECVIENVNGAAFLRPQKSYSIAIAGTSTTSSIPISANTQVLRLATPSSCHFRLGAGATTDDAMVPAGEVVDFSVQPDGGTSYLSVIEASSPTDIGGGGVGDSGLESVNVETLAGNKTITSVDARTHILNGGGASRNVTLDASLHVVGTHIRIAAANDGNLLTIKNSAGTTLAIVHYEQTYEAVYDASGWKKLYDIQYGRFADTCALGFKGGITTTTVSIGTAHLLWATATGVGIGTSPSSLFHVTASGNANALRVDNTTGNGSFGSAPLSDRQLAVAKDIVYSAGNTAQLVACGASNTAKQTAVGYDTTGNFGFIQAYIQNGSWKYLALQPTSGGIVIGNTSKTAGMLLDISTTNDKHAIGIPSLTTTERDALTGVNRMLIYNSTTDKFQGYAAGAWVDLH